MVEQKLYEGIDVGNGLEGLITYMRTDGVYTAPEAIDETRKIILNKYGEKYLPKSAIIYETKMTPGTYEVLCLNVGGFEFPQTTTKVTVKDDVEYKKIDIMDEVKSESDINEGLEDPEKKDQNEAVLEERHL